jgi:very-short-patch-repair endonuclease
LPAIRVHRPRRFEQTRCRSFPITTVPRTLLDYASVAAPHRVRRALAQADYRRLLDHHAIRALLGRGHPGSASLRRALAHHQPKLARTRSNLEERFLALLERGDIPLPEINAIVGGVTVDAYWPGHKLIVELDGQANHGTSAQAHRDHDRDLRLRAGGHAVHRYSYGQITRQSSSSLTYAAHSTRRWPTNQLWAAANTRLATTMRAAISHTSRVI